MGYAVGVDSNKAPLPFLFGVFHENIGYAHPAHGDMRQVF